MKYFSYEWKKLFQSRTLFIVLGGFVFLSLFLFLIQFFQLSTEQENYMNQMSQEREQISGQLAYLQELQEGLSEEDEEYVVLQEQIGEGRQASIYLNQSQHAFDSGESEPYLSAYTDFIYARGEFNALVGGYDYEPTSNDLTTIYHYESFLSGNESYETRNYSLNTPNFIALFLEFISHPFVLTIVVMLVSFVLIGEIDMGSFHLDIMEVKERKRWIRTSQLVSFLVFIGGIVVAAIVGAVLTQLLGYPFIGPDSASWQAPFLSSYSMDYVLTTAGFIVWISTAILLLFLLFIQLFQLVLIYTKNIILAPLLFFTGSFGLYYITGQFAVLQQWFNPFYLFYLSGFLQETSDLWVVCSFGVTGLLILLLHKLFVRKLEHSPIL